LGHNNPEPPPPRSLAALGERVSTSVLKEKKTSVPTSFKTDE